MTPRTQFLGLMMTLILLGLVLFNIWREQQRLEEAHTLAQSTAVQVGTELYTRYCAECHGAAGEGINANPALNQTFIRESDRQALANIIARGRYHTDMTAFALDEGGLLTDQQIEYLVTMLRAGDWPTIENKVLAAGFTPQAPPTGTTQEDVLAIYNTLSANQSPALEQGRTLFAATCAECHGETGEGTADAPQLNSDYVRNMPVSQLLNILDYGVSGSEMDSFRDALSPDEKAVILLLLRNWNSAGGVVMEPTPTIDTSMVTRSGQELFETWCAPCHGVRGEGGSIAPPLNDVPALPVELIQSRVRDGKSAMPAFPLADLPEPELVVLMEYAQQQIIGSALPAIDEASLVQAEALYNSHCGECHGLDGNGVPDVGPPLLKFPPMHASYISYFTRFGSPTTPGIPPSEVSDSDLALIIGYIYRLDETTFD